MSENRFVSGNIIVVYCNFVELESNEDLPQHILERIEVCSRLYERIMKSKPDRSNTIVKIAAADKKIGSMVKEKLLSNGIEESKIVIETSYNGIERLFSIIMNEVERRPNPPVIYFIASYQQKNIFESATESYNGYKIQFEGALDKRPAVRIEQDTKREKLNKRVTNVKEKAKNRMVDMLLNYIFPDSKK